MKFCWGRKPPKVELVDSVPGRIPRPFTWGVKRSLRLQWGASQQLPLAVAVPSLQLLGDERRRSKFRLVSPHETLLRWSGVRPKYGMPVRDILIFCVFVETFAMKGEATYIEREGDVCGRGCWQHVSTSVRKDLFATELFTEVYRNDQQKLDGRARTMHVSIFLLAPGACKWCR